MQINEDAAEIARLTDMQRDRQHDLQRLERLVASEKAAASNAARDNQSLRSELEQLVRAHGKEVEELTLEVDKLRQAGDRKLNEASAMFQREHEEINTKLGHAMDAARLLVRYAIPANLTIKQLTFQKELLSKLGASYYKQVGPCPGHPVDLLASPRRVPDRLKFPVLAAQHGPGEA